VRSLLRHEREHRQIEEQLTGELEMAARVQRELFPRVLPDAPGLDYAGICRPACGVSGDYYDFLALGEDKLGLLLADVSGKGIAAALLGASLHTAIRANAPAAGMGCGDLMVKTNRLLYDTSAPERFATVFYGVYNPATCALTYANAGHNPPMLIRGDECIRLDGLTAPAGLLADIPSAQETIQLLSGDWLLIFSDGIPDAENENGEEFGEDKLLASLNGLGSGTAAQVCNGVAEAVRSHAGGQRQADDITLIAIKVL
jgi:sigma-B regulation protein RsbU (phosphoserine phosphatase)